MIDIIAFDADDTLWHNETRFQATEAQFAALLAHYHPEDLTRARLFETEMRNLAHFGYGVKGFILSMIETAVELTEGEIRGADIRTIIDWGHEMLHAPVELLDGVAETIGELAGRHRLMLLTKGDLFDQESKLARSALGEHFSAVEIVSNKNAQTYRSIITKSGVDPARFLMVGNSLRSDILPALEAGARAVHIPYQTTWAHEHVDDAEIGGRAIEKLSSIRDLPAWLLGVRS
ncbi:MAG: HAD family hydrolase [Thermoanaerobaculia bacterium]|nr:HAD family hydrolase [Thermoanaerobaculia bacterium]